MLRVRPLAPAVLSLMVVTGCGASAESSEAGGEATGKTITLEVTGEDTGKGHVWIQYMFGEKVNSVSGAKLPWRMSARYVSPPDAFYMVFASPGADGGDIACRILLDGKPVETAEGGPDAGVTCHWPPSGTLGEPDD